MKIKEGFEMRQVGDEYVVITVGDAIAEFDGMVKLNATGAFVWNQMKANVAFDELVDAFAKEFSVDKETAETDIKAFIETLKQSNCFAA